MLAASDLTSSLVMDGDGLAGESISSSSSREPPLSILCMLWIYSTACRNVSTLDIFFCFAADGMCVRKSSNPQLTCFTRFLSRAFRRATLAGMGGGIAYPSVGCVHFRLRLFEAAEVEVVLLTSLLPAEAALFLAVTVEFFGFRGFNVDMVVLVVCMLEALSSN